MFSLALVAFVAVNQEKVANPEEPSDDALPIFMELLLGAVTCYISICVVSRSRVAQPDRLIPAEITSGLDAREWLLLDSAPATVADFGEISFPR